MEKSKTDKTASVTSMLKKLYISKSGFYNYLKRIPCKQKLKKIQITAKIKQIHKDSWEIYGASKITRILRNEGIIISEKYVGNIMRENGIKAHYIKPYTVTTKDCDYSSRLKNILKRAFNPKKPNEAWCSDITYIWTNEDGFVYSTSIMDLYSRKIIAWTLSKTLEVKEVMKCLKTAKERRKSSKPVVIQSDRGVHVRQFFDNVNNVFIKCHNIVQITYSLCILNKINVFCSIAIYKTRYYIKIYS